MPNHKKRWWHGWITTKFESHWRYSLSLSLLPLFFSFELYMEVALDLANTPLKNYDKLSEKFEGGGGRGGGGGRCPPRPTIALPILIGYNKASNYIKICLASILMTKQGRSAKISTNFIKRFGYKGDIIFMLNLFIFRD